jgi:quinol monooxygenase YgiN
MMAAVRVVVQFTAESAEAAEKGFQGLVERSKTVQKEPGCLQFEPFRSGLNPQKYSLIELWESQEVIDRRGTPPTPPPGITRTIEHYPYSEH